MSAAHVCNTVHLMLVGPGHSLYEHAERLSDCSMLAMCSASTVACLVLPCD